MDKYTYKPAVFFAKQYTKEMQDKFIALGKNPKENPIRVELDFITDAELFWNWHTKQLEIEKDPKEGCKIIEVNDFIVQSSDGDYSILKPDKFYSMFQKINA